MLKASIWCRTEIGDADGRNLAGALQVGHRRRGFLDRHVGVGPMHLIDVDDVGAQAPLRILDLLVNARLAGVAERLPILPVKTDLGRDQDAIAASAFGQRLLPTISSERPKP